MRRYTPTLLLVLIVGALWGCGPDADDLPPVIPDSLTQIDTTINYNDLNPRVAVHELTKSSQEPLAQTTDTDGLIEDDTIVLAIGEEFREAQEVPPTGLAVTSEKGIVTLAGMVPSLLLKERAAYVAKQVRGVRAVINRITVQPITRTDATLKEEIEDAFRRDAVLEPWEIGVSVQGGNVTVEGRVDSWFEQQRATQVAQSIPGVRSVQNEVVLEPLVRYDFQIEEEIAYALQWDTRLDETNIEVEVDSSVVTLSGFVGSAYAREVAFNKAWVNGVRMVNVDSLRVVPRAYDALHRYPQNLSFTAAEIQQALTQSWRADPRIGATNLQAELNRGTAVLTGQVGSQSAKEAAEENARNTVGVDHVVSKITVQ